MSYQSDIYAAIQGNVALTAIIGDRFSWDIADGTVAAPYLVAQTISGNSDSDLNGHRELSFPLIQITAWAKGKAAAIALISALKLAIEGRELAGASLVSLSYAGEQSTYDQQTKLYGEIIEFRVSTLTN